MARTLKEQNDAGMILAICIILAFALIVVCSVAQSKPQVWKVTAYCTGTTTASGKAVQRGMVACNWLPFGTQVKIEGMSGIYTVEDRGSKRLFGTKEKPVNRLDVYMPSCTEARKFGIQFLKVDVI